MLEDKETINVSIRKIELEDVYYEGIGPLELQTLAKEIELRLEKISKEKNTFDTFKLLAHAALFYAVQSYKKTNNAGTKNKDESKQINTAIEKLSNCLNSLPLK